MPSKWAAFRTKIEPFVAEQSFQSKVDEAKMLILSTHEGDNANINHLAALYAQRKQKKDDLEEQIGDLNVELEALSQLLVDAFENENIQKVELSSGASVYLSDGIYPSVEDREKLFAWIKQHKMSKLLSVNSQTLKGLVGEMLQDGKPAPAGVKVYLKTQARMRNAGRNGEES